MFKFFGSSKIESFKSYSWKLECLDIVYSKSRMTNSTHLIELGKILCDHDFFPLLEYVDEVRETFCNSFHFLSNQTTTPC